jgi:hypothetical protein
LYIQREREQVGECETKKAGSVKGQSDTIFERIDAFLIPWVTFNFAFDKFLKEGTCAPYRETSKVQKKMENKEAAHKYMTREGLPLHGACHELVGESLCLCNSMVLVNV